MDIEDTKHKRMNRFNNGWTVLECTEQRKLGYDDTPRPLRL